MLANLITNAIKFTPEGGAVSVAVTRSGEDVHVAVADTGVGIPEDEVGRLFDRFFRASTTTTQPGTGLGLPIVKTIAEAHGGSVTVESTVGVGSTFVVDLPLQPGAAVPAAEASTEVAT